MNNFSKVVICIVVCIAGWWCYDNFLSGKIHFPDFSTKEETNIIVPKDNQDTNITDIEKEKTSEENKDHNIYIYMLTTDKAGNQFLKPVERPLPPGEDKLAYSIKQLFNGPNKSEISKGIYSEIPESAKLIGIYSTDNKVVIDITGSFSYGGGSDSIYSRMRQLIKTSLANTDKNVYLNIDGKQAEVIGGEGISITQPLSEKSLDE